MSSRWRIRETAEETDNTCSMLDLHGVLKVLDNGIKRPKRRDIYEAVAKAESQIFK